MNLLKECKTNWKYILIVVILAVIVGGGILSYCWLVKKEVSFITKWPFRKVIIPPECIGPLKPPQISESNEVKIVDLLRDTPKSKNILFYLFSKKYSFPIKPEYTGPIIKLNYEDPLFKREEEVANFLHNNGFSITYTNVLYSIEGSYSFRISLIGCKELFESKFHMDIKCHKNEKGEIIVDSFTPPLFPLEIKDFTRTLEAPPPPISPILFP